MRLRRYVLLTVGVLAVVAIAAIVYNRRISSVSLVGCTAAGRPPAISPDFSGATIPPNIAPLSFVVREPGRRYCVHIRGASASPIEVVSRTGSICIPIDAWASLLAANRGGRLRFDVHVEDAEGQWHRFDPISATVAREAIDSHLVYRLLPPGFATWARLRIHQRDLTSYDESVVLDNVRFGEGCLNCHAFLANRPDTMMLHTRGGSGGSSTLLVRNGVATRANTRTRYGLAGYTSWHPSGNLVVCAVCKVRQFFHTARPEVRDVIDLDSTLMYYLPDEDRARTHPSLGMKNRLESYPCWAPDGKFLYFASAEKLWADDTVLPPDRYAEVRYDLVRVRYDAEADTWGPPETVLASADFGLSITQPKVSPDGRFIVVTMAEYGCFPIFHRNSDLYILDTESGKCRRLELNSDECDSWHSWSSNGRWLVFSSKRGNGLFARPHISYIDTDGKAHTPFVVPQSDPTFYDSFIMTYNVPELITGPMPVGSARLGRLIRDPAADSVITGASPKAGTAPVSPDVSRPAE